MESFKKLWILIMVLLTTLQAGVFKNFVQVRDGRLMDGERELQFFSMNIPNLLLIEDNMSFDEKNPWRLPDRFEIYDALLSIKQMGGQVARTYTITVYREDDLPGTPKHVLAPGKLNEQAFRSLDTVLAVANELGVRLIIPLVDNWKWMGGIGQYAAFRGKPADDFWRDEQLKADFKQTVQKILTRKNSVTGVRYKDDPAIMIWELGNELRGCPLEWIEEMAAFIKSIDENHLINDGRQSSDLKDDVLNSPYVDVLSTHHYEGDPEKMLAHIAQNVKQIAGKKPYYLGEFGFISTNGLRAVMEKVKSEKLSGALLWSLRFHNRDGGFYWHSEPFGAGLYKAFHWPGFPSGQAYDEQGVFELLKQFNGLNLDVLPRAQWLPVTDVGYLRWQGATGACAYLVQRSTSKDGPWQAVSPWLDDASQAYTPQFNDQTVQLDQHYFYRIQALFPNGQTTTSEVMGPLKAKARWLIDDGDHWGNLYRFEGKLEVKKDNNRSFKEDLSRLAGQKGTEVVYRVPGQILSFRVDCFQESATVQVHCLISEDGKQFLPIEAKMENFAINQKDYEYWQPIRLRVKAQGKNAKFLKIKFEGEAQLGRVEIEYR